MKRFRALEILETSIFHNNNADKEKINRQTFLFLFKMNPLIF